MINRIKRWAFALLLMVSTGTFAQEDVKDATPAITNLGTTVSSQKVEMADALYQSGKIYVVVTVLSIIFVGLFSYLIMLDRKIGKLEKEINKK